MFVLTASLSVFGSDEHMVQLPGGKFQMGSSSMQSRDEEGPIREVTVKPFAIDKFPVTNRDFREFVREKKYKTEAEAFGWSFVFEDFVSEELKKKVTQKLESAPWWLPVEKAFWRQVGVNQAWWMGNTPDSASDNLSFRCAADIPSRTTKSSRTKPEL
ncbi:hypothetical protein CIB84_008468 [Bambusicola thoracicus]|uniref:Sulfatase-modifying factor enzyme-like domain-containing protein n=1 Tax=Bambusicola thoracicus TaxID=9083 RepID=A0A2P4SUM5_BAMTH|nr:hypothetical protein CIB84_008468 [Bambusicola thoracicus]